MGRKRGQFDGKAPFCADCKRTSDVHVVAVAGQGNVWLCSSCEFLREHPDAKRGGIKKLPIDMRPKPLQKETLF